jgi:uncharacterized protein
MSEKSKAVSTSGRFYWHELAARDVNAQKGFYGELFGWKTRDMEMGPAGTYTILSVNGKDIGGIAKLEGKQSPSWLAYVTTQNVDDAVTRAKKHGADVEVPATDIPGVGRFAILADKQGARIAPFTPAEENADSADRPGLGTFCWNELVTQDPSAAGSLYRDVFGWTSESKDMGPAAGTYTILKRGDRQSGGIMKAMDKNAPSLWLSYIAVEDVDAAFEKVKRLKGKGLMPPADIPGIGRFAVVSDPEGAAFALFKG